MDALEEELADIGVTELRLTVIAANSAALGFYERRGMTLTTHVMLGPVPRAQRP